ncbi:cbb3-type cytochrome c oxidase N-terminal domain-containing protein [Chitinophaga sp. XS-30]|uniref:cbb3-type cytochrome c oxidase N-terminal domain-containing protein n=1 Tax=Chitinophaga sp. XS-30 TaxID=2604421 RepID=UPI0011DC8915|nr:cbb3-type cytochrome c oxidase N-terminal domain-containing protein [Chitinophaga sp. XS-30]QEH41001.1 c-type cytochrome [Chitinophaga sp. XS-30]
MRCTTKRLLAFVLLMLPALAASAQGPASSPFKDLSHPVALLLLCVAFGLLIAILILGYTVMGAMDIYRERIKKEKILPVALLLLISTGAQAQGASTSIVPGLSDTVFTLMALMIGVELLVIMMLISALRVLTGIKRKEKVKKAHTPAPGKPRINWMEKLNRTKSLDAVTEAEADMGHDYDGIRELNNPTPPWWRYGFYFSILFAVVYLWRYHVTHAAPLQLEELAIAEAKAAAAKEAYLKNAANNIDENNVTLLAEAADIETGKKLFVINCAACHGPDGQGTVGPNLTDNYWIHGGKVNEIFSTIKYGVPEKGMKSWKEDFSPKQLAQLTAYIRTIRGTNPANPKEQQGTLYEGEE